MSSSWLCNIATVFVRALTLIAKFILVICLVKFFPPKVLGIYGIIAALVAYSLFFLGLEFYNYTSRALVGSTPGEQVIIVRDQFIFYSLMFLVFSPCFMILTRLQLIPSSLYILFGILVIVEHISNELMRILIVMYRPFLGNLVYFLRQGLWAYVLIPVFMFYPASRQFEWVMIAWIFGASLSILLSGVGLYHLPWNTIWQEPIHWRWMHQGVRKILPFLVSAFGALCILYVERFFINYYRGIEAVGIYTFYSGLTLAVHNLVHTGVAQRRLAELISAWKKNDIVLFQNTAMNIFKQTCIATMVLVVLSLICIYPFLQLINKTFYFNHLNIFFILLIGTACRSIADVPLFTLYAQHQDKLLLYINTFAFCVMLAGNTILVPSYGLSGAAVSSAFASVILLITAMISVIKHTFRRCSQPLVQV